MYKAIFWDNDGVLVNTEPLYFASTKQILAEIGINLTMDFYKHDHLKYNKSAFDFAREKGYNESQIADLRKERDRIYIEKISREVPFIDGVLETLNQLHGRFQMGVVTASPKSFMNVILKARNLGSFFDFVLTSDDVKNVKPDPELYLLALKTVNLKPEECLVIEDTERGVIAAKEAGITCYAIPNELSAHNDFNRADKVLKSIRHLPELILK